MTIRLVRLTGQDASVWLDAALDIYITAMDYPRGTEFHRSALWREHIARPGWSAFGALETLPATRSATDGVDLSRRRMTAPLSPGNDEALVGIAYGYRGAGDQWWNQQLRAGLRQDGRAQADIDAITTGYFELTELHVHPRAQGRGIGQWLLHQLLTGRPEDHVLLSTPEIADERNRAWSLYRRLGFVDVLRGFRFTGDPRPFAFLGRSLPLTEPAVAAGAAPGTAR